MTSFIGNYSLTLAVLTAMFGVMACIAAARFDSRRWALAAYASTGVLAALYTLASAALFTAMLNSDFRFAYVVGYTEKALPDGYKMAAFWAGQEGSLLLWGWLLAIMGVIFTATYRPSFSPVGRHEPNRTLRQQARTARFTAIATMLIVTGFFALLMLFTANPFRELAEIPADGRGLNPMLQDPGMLAHPPLLFLGYAGYTVPFAILMGSLVAGTRDNRWVLDLRRWSLAAWVFLSVGILLGAQWAYVELGWGGYWAWDPVENASLLPWLTGTAMLHSITVQARRGMFKVWNVCLIAMTFVLCIFGTYLTRSGVVNSVHTFGKSLVGNFFLVFMLLTIALSAGMILWRSRLLKSEQPLESLISREGAFLAGNVLLLIMTATTLVGTIFPLISGLFVAEPISVGEPFYNKVVVPMGLLLLAVMALGPVLVAGEDAGPRMARRLIVPVMLGLAAALAAWVGGLHNIWALGCVLVTITAAMAIVIDLIRSLLARVRLTGENPVAALLRIIDGDHRRYGGQITHVGMIMIAIGVTGSSVYGLKETFQLSPGQSASLGGYQVQFMKLHEVREAHYTAVEAMVAVTDPAGRTATLRPQRRFYDKHIEQPNSEVALRTNVREDLYVILAGWDKGGALTAIQVMVNPLVLWIWIGGIVLTLGGVFCLLPRLVPRLHRVAKPSLDNRTAEIPATA